MYSSIWINLYNNVFFNEVCTLLNGILDKESKSIIDCEIYSPPKRDYYKAKRTLKNLLKSNPIQFRIRYYKKRKNINIDLSDYNDYLQSDCIAIFFLVDGGEIEIYAKSERVLLCIFDCLRKFYNLDCTLVNEGEDGRNSFIL